MRITGGNAARRILKTPKGLAVRPTPDLVKQAVFNSLGGRVVGARVLELFAGTGALSLECLSRGAASAMGIEKSHKHAEFIRANAHTAGLDPALEVRVQAKSTPPEPTPERFIAMHKATMAVDYSPEYTRHFLNALSQTC